MFWFWSPHAGWIFGLLSGLFWIAVIVAAVLLLRREVPNLGRQAGPSHALRILEERYAGGEISRDEFLERREVLMRTSRVDPPPPVGPPPRSSEPTVQLPDKPPGGPSPGT